MWKNSIFGECGLPQVRYWQWVPWGVSWLILQIHRRKWIILRWGRFRLRYRSQSGKRRRIRTRITFLMKRSTWSLCRRLRKIQKYRIRESTTLTFFLRWKFHAESWLQWMQMEWKIRPEWRLCTVMNRMLPGNIWGVVRRWMKRGNRREWSICMPMRKHLENVGS